MEEYINHFIVLRQNHVAFRKCNTEYYSGNPFETVYPFFTLRSLPTDIKHPDKMFNYAYGSTISISPRLNEF